MADGNGNGDWKTHTARWLFGQPTIVILLFIGIGGFGWFGRHMILVGIPSHLKQIQEGYEAIERSHREERKERDALYGDAIGKLSLQIEKSDERHTEWLRNMKTRAANEIENGAAAAVIVPPREDEGS